MRWFLAAAAILLVSLVFDLGLLAYAMYVLLAVMLVSRLLARTWHQNLSASRECNKLTAEIGETVAVVVNVKNKGRIPIAWVLLEDLLPRSALMYNPPNLKVKGRRIELAGFKGGRGHAVLYQLECNQRGYYQIGPLVMETGDLFGLHRRWRVATEPHFLLVYPKVLPIEGYDIASRRPIGEVRMSHRLYEDPTRNAGVRDYQPGDPLNRIHWRATARTGSLHSKVYEPSTVVGATIVLDFHQAGYAREHEPMRSELAVTCAASLANALYGMNQQVGLVTNGRDAADRIRTQGWDVDYGTRGAAQSSAAMIEKSERLQPVIVPTRRGPEQFMRILETLARLELTDGLTLAQLCLEAASRLPRDASVIVILSAVTDEAAIALGSLVRRGFAVTALVNLHEPSDYAQHAGRLLAQGVESRHQPDEAAIVEVCRRAGRGR